MLIYFVLFYRDRIGVFNIRDFFRGMGLLSFWARYELGMGEDLHMFLGP